MAAKEYFDCCEGSTLTLHDTRIVALLCMGLARKDICDVMNIKMSTLGGEISTIFSKTRTGKGSELVSKAVHSFFDNRGNYIHNGAKNALFAAQDEVSKRFAASAAVARILGK
jgi:DNA-binding CsgD family transcriptional regulator